MHQLKTDTAAQQNAHQSDRIKVEKGHFIKLNNQNSNVCNANMLETKCHLSQAPL